jgi:hypothetical protein
LSGPADERFALPVFIGARGFAEEEEPRLRVTHTEHRLRTVGYQIRALLAGSHFISQQAEGLGPLLQREFGALGALVEQ